ncbi:Enolase superfamily enzyme related to L-alanine-DL-glutamate epimerase [Sinomonas atrocyanea]|uniref:Enolase superfamily enzyme related to L-alanine-DL-glutamate epimerase n=1 Tax=Sinomonas atrocyanea TaxID=37927 RepID=A0A126ZZ23_9MICC|nr:galactonate dehydratase [Sinomonas atrocyanea]AMM31655.1 Enolase superfamily enzyme related to L-alanine-DL-glutamate epimerase [Sinomonas atrocyanea]GEB64193.1 galactonate dehydratase [Sinomonas atrocyanea]GGG57092.1 galactonate dehydratase [Sinomonas atrocyanea]
MKITAVETLVVNARLRNWVFVKVSTDREGLVGWGEATLEWQSRAVAAAVADLAPVVLGQDPRRIEYLWQAMQRDHFFQGGVVTSSALSGIDQALWDINARLYDVPAYQLLGGAVRDKLRMYDHLGGGDSSVVYGPATVERFGEAAQKAVADGFTALKILAVPSGSGLPSEEDLNGAAAAMRAVREAVGGAVDIMVDLHGRTSAAGAIAYGHALAPYKPWFFEEPCQPGNPEALAAVARALPFPVAAGERLISLQEFRTHLAANACAVLQPDICHVGGPTGLRKIAALAESHHIPLAPHNPLGPIATAVNQHMAFATPGVIIQEVMRSDVPWRNDVVSGTFPIVDGFITEPAGPGWGITVNEEAAAEHPYEPELQIHTRASDGSVSDW